MIAKLEKHVNRACQNRVEAEEVPMELKREKKIFYICVPGKMEKSERVGAHMGGGGGMAPHQWVGRQ